MDRVDAAKSLSAQGWLSQLPDNIREDWLRGARLIEIPKGDQVFNVQDDPRFMIGLARGVVGALMSYHPQHARLAMIYGPGNWFGDAAVLTDHAHRGTAVARTDCTCLIVPAAHVDAVASRHPKLWRWMAMNVLFQFDSFVTMAEAAIHRDPTCQLITMILSLSKLNPRMTVFDLSSEEVGEMVGLSRNTVTKSLRDLEATGLIERDYARLRVLSVERLQAELTKRTAR